MASKKLIAFILTVAIFLGGSYSAYATDWFFLVKEFGLDPAGRAIAKVLLRTLTNKLIEKIQGSGEGGGPAFVQNWTNLITDNQYKGEDVFKAILASTPLCNYLKKDVKDLFGVRSTQIIPPLGQNVRVDDLTPFKLRAACTMPSNFNVQNYQRDFSGNGGWNAFSRMLEPQNNYYGLLFGSLSEVARQRNLYSQAGQGEVQAGSGYTSIRGSCQRGAATCENNVCTGASIGPCRTNADCSGPAQPSQARCAFMGKVFTPADLLGKTAAGAMDKNLEGIVNSDELVETLIAVGNAALTRLGNFAEQRISENNDETAVIQTDKNALAEEYCSAAKPNPDARIANRTKFPGYIIDDTLIGSFIPPLALTGVYLGPLGSLFEDVAQLEPGPYADGGPEEGPCEALREEDNAFPYQRCTLACYKATGLIPPETGLAGIPQAPIVSATPTPPASAPFVPCDNPPDTQSPNPMTVMEEVKNEFPNIDLVNERTRDEFTAIVAWRLHQADANWGRKRAAGGPSTDTLGYLRPDIGPDRFEAVDLIIGTATSATLNRGCYGVVPSDQTWIEPSPAP